MLKELSNTRYMNRKKRLEQVSAMLEEGISPTQISKQLAIRWETIKKDVELLTILGQGSLSPEICAKKRVGIDDKFCELDEETLNTYRLLLKEGKVKTAAEYLRISVDIQKFRAKLWGLDQKVDFSPKVVSENVHFNKYDIKMSDRDFSSVRDVISRKSDNLGGV